MDATKNAIEVRDAERSDVPRMLAIYNEAVMTMASTADWEPVSLETRLAWFDERKQKDLAMLVAVENGRIVGWASLNPYSHKLGYQFTLENSVYVDRAAWGQGIGSVLLERLVERARARGAHTLIASVDALNAASIRIHEKVGFRTCGHYKELVFKFDRWLDVIHMQLML